MTDTTIKAAEAMREAAIGVCEDWATEGNHAPARLIARDIRALPLPEPAPDPRDALLAKAREALEVAESRIRTASEAMREAIIAALLEDNTFDEADGEVTAFGLEHRKFVAKAIEFVRDVLPPGIAAVMRTPDEARHARLCSIVKTALTMFSSPTRDPGDSHGARGQTGWIIWENSIDYIAAEIVREAAK